MTEEIPDNPRTDKRMPALLSLSQAATVLGVVRQYAHRMAKRGELPGQQVGETWVFRTAVVLRVRDERRERKDAPPA
ncbi:MAG TPA: helix-turn-helix domain-containing protein [Candidatus Dormibacteraeota bacterium]